MGMYATHETAEDSLCMETQWLKQYGYFCGYKSGGIKWIYGDRESSTGFIVNTRGNSPNIRFKYSAKNRGNDQRKHMDYSFPLVKVPCNLGGFRWAFKCSLSKNDRYCGRTVYKLYNVSGSDYFGCRKCVNIVYESQRESGSRFEFFGKILDNEKKHKEICNSIHKWHYKGKPTKKVRRLRQLEKRMPSLRESIEIKKNFLGNLRMHI